MADQVAGPSHRDCKVPIPRKLLGKKAERKMYERKRTVSYLVQWKGQPREDATWETQASLTLKCPRLVNDFERKWRAQLVDRGSFIQIEGRKFRLFGQDYELIFED